MCVGIYMHTYVWYICNSGILSLAFEPWNKVPASSSCWAFWGKHTQLSGQECCFQWTASLGLCYTLHRQKLELCVSKLRLGHIHLYFLKFCCSTAHSSMRQYCSFALWIPCGGWRDGYVCKRTGCKRTSVQMDWGYNSVFIALIPRISAAHWNTVKQTFNVIVGRVGSHEFKWCVYPSVSEI